MKKRILLWALWSVPIFAAKTLATDISAKYVKHIELNEPLLTDMQKKLGIPMGIEVMFSTFQKKPNRSAPLQFDNLTVASGQQTNLSSVSNCSNIYYQKLSIGKCQLGGVSLTYSFSPTATFFATRSDGPSGQVSCPAIAEGKP